MTRAIICTPTADYEQSAARCLEYLQACGYEFKGIVRDWATAQRMMGNGECTVAIVASPSELAPDRKPRIEFVSHGRPTNDGKFWDERTRVIRRRTWEE